MIHKFLNSFTAMHGFFSHKEQQEFEIELAMRKEKVLTNTFFSF